MNELLEVLLWLLPAIGIVAWVVYEAHKLHGD